MSGAVIRGNIVYGHPSYGIAVCGDALVENNVVCGNGLGIGGGRIKNTIFWRNGVDIMWYESIEHCFIEDKDIPGNIRGDDPGFVGWGEFSWENPLYVDVRYAGDDSDGTKEKPYRRIFDALKSFDYHLRWDSVCRGAGAGGVDIGAYPEATTYSLRGSSDVKIIVRPGRYDEYGKETMIVVGPGRCWLKSEKRLGASFGGGSVLEGSIVDGFVIEEEPEPGREYSNSGLCCWCADMEIRNCLIRGAYMGIGFGKAAPVNLCSGGLARNCIVEGCRIGVMFGNEGAEIDGLTITKCSDPIGGGGYGTGKIRNSIIYWNELPDAMDPTTDISYSCVETKIVSGEGVIYEEPGFVDWSGGDYHLRVDSPCRDTGTTEVLVSGEQDIDGEPRWHGRSVDMGADEYVDEWRNEFETGEEGWEFKTLPGFFSEPEGEWSSGSLVVAVNDNREQFGFWTSGTGGGFVVLPGNIYRAEWRVSTDITPALGVPMLRLRLNATDEVDSDYLVLSSVGDGSLMPSPAGRSYEMWLSPFAVDVATSPVYASGKYYLNFDVGNFDEGDALSGRIMLDEVVIERVALDELSTPTLIKEYSFEGNAEGWHSGGIPAQYTLPIADVTSRGLVLRAVDNTNTFGWWSSQPEVMIEKGELYRVEYRVSSDESERTRVPQFRLRLNLYNEQLAMVKATPSVSDARNSPTPQGLTYALYFSLPEFGYFRIPQELCTGSSIMPQKRNPCGLELVRARASTIIACHDQVLGIVKALPSGYNRDFQETKRPFLHGLKTTIACVRVMNLTFRKLEVDEARLLAAFTPEVFATDEALRLVAEGVPFRDAYRRVAESLDRLEARDPREAIARRTHAGGPASLRLEIAEAAIDEAGAFLRERRDAFHETIKALLGR